MKASRDTAGHALAKGNEREKERNNAQKALALAKVQEAQKKGNTTGTKKRRAYFFSNN